MTITGEDVTGGKSTIEDGIEKSFLFDGCSTTGGGGAPEREGLGGGADIGETIGVIEGGETGMVVEDFLGNKTERSKYNL